MTHLVTRRTLSAALLSAALGAVFAAPIARADGGPPPPPAPIPLVPSGTIYPDQMPGDLDRSNDSEGAFADVTGVADVVPATGPAFAPPVAAPPAPGVQPGPPPPPMPAESPNPLLDPASLRDIVGRIALYPDVVLGSLLPASTSPLDVIEAAALVKQNAGRVAAVPANSPWQPAVQAMLQYPDALLKMNEDLAWLRRLGAAVEADQDAVLAAIQAFRTDTDAAGNLPSSPQVTVTKQAPPQGQEGDAIIVIEPAQPTVVYVPSYDPVVICQPSSYPYGLYSWGVGVDCGPWGPWGWSYLAWGFGWGWYYGGHYGGYYGGHYGGYYGGYGHHGGGGYGYYRPRHEGATVVGHSANYGPSSIRHGSGFSHHSTLRSSTTASTFQPRTGRSSGSAAYGPRGASRGGDATASRASGPSTTGRGQGAASANARSGSYGPSSGRHGKGATGATALSTQGRAAGSPAGTGTWNTRGTQFRNAGGTPAAGATTTQPRHYTPGASGTPRTFSTQGAPQSTRSFAPQGQGTRSYQPQVQPRTHTPQAQQPRSFAPQVQPRTHTPQAQPRSYTPQAQQPRSFAPQSAPRNSSPQYSSRSFSSPSRSSFSGGSSSWGGGRSSFSGGGGRSYGSSRGGGRHR